MALNKLIVIYSCANIYESAMVISVFTKILILLKV